MSTEEEIKRLTDLIRDHVHRIDRLERCFDKIQGRFKISKESEVNQDVEGH